MIRILIVTSVRLMSDLLQAAFANQPDLQVVGCVEEQSLALHYRDTCDVVVVSHEIQDALGLIQALRRGPHGPAALVVGLPNVEAVILRFLEAGATGCIREQDSSADLVRAVRLAARRQVALNADVFPVVLKRVTALAHKQRSGNALASPASEKNLTAREREILRLIAQGYGNREIAQQLTIQLGTAKNHVHNILDKLNVKSRQDAAVYFALGLA